MEYGVKLRHAAFFKEFLADRETDLKGSVQVRALSELRAEKANIWAAWRWAVLHSEEVSLNRAISALSES